MPSTRLLVSVATIAVLLALVYFRFYESPAQSVVRRQYSRDGTLMVESSHDSSGRLHGKMTVYDENGLVASVTIFYHGVWVEQKTYLSDGTEVHR